MSALPRIMPIPTPAPARLRPADRPLRSVHHASLADAEPLREAWDELAGHTGAAVTQSWDWCRTWHEHHGDRAESRVHAYLETTAEGPRLVGLLPYAIARASLGPLTLRTARLLGTDGPSAPFQPALDPTWRGAILEASLRRLVEHERCEALHLGPVPEGPALDALREGAAALGDALVPLRDRPAGTVTHLELPAEGSWLDACSRNQRTSIRKGLRRLDAAGPVRTDLVHAPREAHGALDGLARLHARQWKTTGRPGHFRDWPGALTFHGALVHRLARTGRVRFHHLIVGDEVIARQYVVLQGTHASCRLAARSIEPKWRQAGVGLVSLARLFDDLAAAGVRTVDLGVGDYAYQRRLGGRETPLRSLLLVANRPSVLARARAMSAAGDAVDFAYYRAWYHRLAPALARRVRLLRRGLSPTWIRSRL